MKSLFAPVHPNRDEDGEYTWPGSILTQFDKAVRDGEASVPDPLAYAKVTHLHLRHIKGHFIWVLSLTRNSVCHTKRCRPVVIK